ncbi:MAG: hypothetical protein RIG27_31885 [Coleofasciculus sp. F4-SAH-05]
MVVGCHLSFVIRHLSFVICHSSFVIRHSSENREQGTGNSPPVLSQ